MQTNLNDKLQLVKALFKHVRSISNHQEEMIKLKGEKFNLFTILNLEANENKTHSAFLGELLNPSGSHLFGARFLELFLQAVHYFGELDIETTQCNMEQGIGSRNDENKTGGRIDIYLSDKENNTISIENKIYAIDQYAQIERYVNWNKPKNTVYYLNLDGKSPDSNSVGDMKSGEDFHHITYKDEIVDWLDLYMKEAVNHPILRETIKQYILLIKKLTKTMDTQHEKEINVELIKNIEIAEIISSQLSVIKNEIGTGLRNAVIEELKKGLSTEYDITEGARITAINAQIWIHPKNDQPNKLIFGMESFNSLGNMNGDLYLGIFSMNGLMETRIYPEHFKQYSDYWPHFIKFGAFENENINMGNSNMILNIYLDKDGYKKRLAEHMAAFTIGFIREHEAFVKEINNQTNLG